jgi:hypothetical protein
MADGNDSGRIRAVKTYGFSAESFDSSLLPDFDTDFLPPEDIEAFVQALSAPDPVQSPYDVGARSPSLRSGSSFDLFTSKQRQSPSSVDVAATESSGDLTVPQQPNGSSSLLFTAKSDWAPIHERVLGRRGSRRAKQRRTGRRPQIPGRRTRDETREGYLYALLKWPFLLFVVAWVLGLAAAYIATRAYVATYERAIAWRGRRARLRGEMRAAVDYNGWVAAARKLDEFLGNQAWMTVNEYAYYDSRTVMRVVSQLSRYRSRAERASKHRSEEGNKAAADLKSLVEACVKNNFVGVESPRLYSQTYYGTKNLVQDFVDEGT